MLVYIVNKQKQEPQYMLAYIVYRQKQEPQYMLVYIVNEQKHTNNLVWNVRSPGI